MGSRRTARLCGECTRKNPGNAYFCVECLSPLVAKPFDILLGQTICGYLLEKKLGESDLGVVFLARGQGQPFAVRVLAPRFSMDSGRKARLLDAIKRLSRVVSLGVVKIQKVFVKGGFLFMVAPYHPGGTVRALLRNKGTLGRQQAIAIVRQTAVALAAATTVQVVHGDVKPENLLLTAQGDIVLADFGLRRSWSVDATRSAEGTPEYMSPEHVTPGHELDVRSDLFALGCLLFELVTGRPPFVADSMAELRRKVQTETVGDRLTRLPPRLAGVIARLLEKEPRRRFQTPQQLCDALDDAAKEPELPWEDARDGNLESTPPPSGGDADDFCFDNLADLSQSRSEQYMLFESTIEDDLRDLQQEPTPFAFPAVEDELETF